jgi:hypothetical protein
MIGATNPLASAAGSIRGDYCIEGAPPRPRLRPRLRLRSKPRVATQR